MSPLRGQSKPRAGRQADRTTSHWPPENLLQHKRQNGCPRLFPANHHHRRPLPVADNVIKLCCAGRLTFVYFLFVYRGIGSTHLSEGAGRAAGGETCCIVRCIFRNPLHWVSAAFRPLHWLTAGECAKPRLSGCAESQAPHPGLADKIKAQC